MSFVLYDTGEVIFKHPWSHIVNPHLALKFLISSIEVRVIHTDQKEARRCYHESLKKREKEVGIEGIQEAHIVEINQGRKINMRKERRGLT